MNDKNEKKELIVQAIHVGIFFIVLPVILFFIANPSQNKRNEGLKIATQAVLTENFADFYTVDEFLPVKTPLTMSAAVFSLNKNQPDKKTEDDASSFAVIVRVTGFAGALPLVYIFDGNTEAFAGIAGNCGKIAPAKKEGLENSEKDEETFEASKLTVQELFDYGLNYKTIDFWKKRAKLLVNQCQQQGQI